MPRSIALEDISKYSRDQIHITTLDFLIASKNYYLCRIKSGPVFTTFLISSQFEWLPSLKPQSVPQYNNWWILAPPSMLVELRFLLGGLSEIVQLFCWRFMPIKYR
jgi:hypothetical protein